MACYRNGDEKRTLNVFYISHSGIGSHCRRDWTANVGCQRANRVDLCGSPSCRQRLDLGCSWQIGLMWMMERTDGARRTITASVASTRHALPTQNSTRYNSVTWTGFQLTFKLQMSLRILKFWLGRMYPRYSYASLRTEPMPIVLFWILCLGLDDNNESTSREKRYLLIAVCTKLSPFCLSPLWSGQIAVTRAQLYS